MYHQIVVMVTGDSMVSCNDHVNNRHGYSGQGVTVHIQKACSGKEYGYHGEV